MAMAKARHPSLRQSCGMPESRGASARAQSRTFVLRTKYKP